MTEDRAQRPAVSNEYLEYRPSLARRFWLALGFRSHVPELTDDMEALAGGWIMTNAVIRPHFLDRLRFLICGRAVIRVQTCTEHEPGHALSASSFELEAPFLTSDL